MSDSLWPHESQHTRPPCPPPTPGVHPNSRPLSQWCHPAISSSVGPSSSCPQPLPASESFPMSQLFAWGGQSTRVSALAWLDLLAVQGTLKSLLQHHSSKASILQNNYDYYDPRHKSQAWILFHIAGNFKKERTKFEDKYRIIYLESKSEK